jgi:hypothetical protein
MVGMSHQNLILFLGILPVDFFGCSMASTGYSMCDDNIEPEPQSLSVVLLLGFLMVIWTIAYPRG